MRTKDLQILLDSMPGLGDVKVSEVKMMKGWERPLHRGPITIHVDGTTTLHRPVGAGLILPPPSEMGKVVVVKSDSGLFVYLG